MFTPLSGWNVVSIRDYLVDEPTVVELGNQTYDVGDRMLHRIISSFENNPSQSNPNRVHLDQLRSFLSQNQTRKPTTAEFYKALGFKSYDAIDVNSKYGSMIMDLNYDLEETFQYFDQFDVVTNNGTGEHIFNQFMVLKNIHHLTKPNGVMIHLMPFMNYVNHGFFNFQPMLYSTLSAVNGYRLLKLSIGERNGYEIAAEIPDLPIPVRYVDFKENHFTMRYEDVFKTFGKESSLTAAVQKMHQVFANREYPDLLIVAVMQKTSDEPFRAPMDYKYIKGIESPTLQEKYATQLQNMK